MQPRLNWVYGIGIRNWTPTEANKRSAGARKSSHHLVFRGQAAESAQAV
jgi:hypothetical protein